MKTNGQESRVKKSEKENAFRLLIIEDESDMCELLEMFFSHQGYEVTAAQTEAGAWGLLEKNQYDLVIADWNLAGVLALDLVKWIQSKWATVPIVIFTGAEDPEALLARTLAGRGISVLSKRAGLDRLAAKVSQLLATDGLKDRVGGI